MAGGVVYSYLACWTAVVLYDVGFEWFVFRVSCWLHCATYLTFRWMPVLFVVSFFLTSFARMNLGAHYLSDCIGGLIWGAISALTGALLTRLTEFGCISCRFDACYAQASDVGEFSGFLYLH